MATCEELLTSINTLINRMRDIANYDHTDAGGLRIQTTSINSNTSSILTELDTLNSKTFVNDLSTLESLLNSIKINTANSGGDTTIDLTTLESYGQHEVAKLNSILEMLSNISTKMSTSTQNQVSIYDQLVLLTQKQASNDHMIRILNHLSLKLTGTEVE